MLKTIRKYLLLVVAVLALVCSVAFAACGGDDNKEHVCGHVCEICEKCTDKDCDDPVCAEKCEGHEPAGHECGDVCPECGKCLTDCEEPECAEKCEGHGSEHEHEYEFVSDGEEGHHQECKDGDASTATEPHNYGDDNVCDDCGYEKSEEVPPVTELPEAPAGGVQAYLTEGDYEEGDLLIESEHATVTALQQLGGKKSDSGDVTWNPNGDDNYVVIDGGKHVQSTGANSSDVIKFELEDGYTYTIQVWAGSSSDGTRNITLNGETKATGAGKALTMVEWTELEAGTYNLAQAGGKIRLFRIVVIATPNGGTENPPVHEHEYVYVQDGETGHHQECVDGDDVTAIVAHNYGADNICADCGYEKAEEIPPVPGSYNLSLTSPANATIGVGAANAAVFNLVNVPAGDYTVALQVTPGTMGYSYTMVYGGQTFTLDANTTFSAKITVTATSAKTLSIYCDWAIDDELNLTVTLAVYEEEQDPGNDNPTTETYEVKLNESRQIYMNSSSVIVILDEEYGWYILNVDGASVTVTKENSGETITLGQSFEADYRTNFIIRGTEGSLFTVTFTQGEAPRQDGFEGTLTVDGSLDVTFEPVVDGEATVRATITLQDVPDGYYKLAISNVSRSVWVTLEVSDDFGDNLGSFNGWPLSNSEIIITIYGAEQLMIEGLADGTSFTVTLTLTKYEKSEDEKPGEEGGKLEQDIELANVTVGSSGSPTAIELGTTVVEGKYTLAVTNPQNMGLGDYAQYRVSLTGTADDNDPLLSMSGSYAVGTVNIPAGTTHIYLYSFQTGLQPVTLLLTYVGEYEEDQGNGGVERPEEPDEYVIEVNKSLDVLMYGNSDYISEDKEIKLTGFAGGTYAFTVSGTGNNNEMFPWDEIEWTLKVNGTEYKFGGVRVGYNSDDTPIIDYVYNLNIVIPQGCTAIYITAELGPIDWYLLTITLNGQASSTTTPDPVEPEPAESKSWDVTCAEKQPSITGDDGLTVAFVDKNGNTESGNAEDFKFDGKDAKLTLTLDALKAGQTITIKVYGYSGSSIDGTDPKEYNPVDLTLTATNATAAADNAEDNKVTFSGEATKAAPESGTFVYTVNADGTVTLELARVLGATTRLVKIEITVA